MDMPEVVEVEVSEDGVRLVLFVAGTLNVFNGHFDNAPIVPGVTQVYWALEYCSRYLQPVLPEAIEQIEALKFQNVIPPDQSLVLNMGLQNNRLLFEFTSSLGRHSSGRIVIVK